MTAECHSVVRAPAVRVTRQDACGTVTDTGCDYATTESITEIALNKVWQDRQDALQLNANGDICVDKPKAPILRWYEVTITFCNVDPELFNIVSAEPLILNDAVDPVAVGWCTLPDSAAASNFALEFWVGTEDDGCDDGEVVYGYGTLMRIRQGVINNVTVNNGVINFSVTGIAVNHNQWGVGPYNVLINESGVNSGLPGPLLEAANPLAFKCFFWTKLAPPPGDCGCQDLTPAVQVLPLTGSTAVARTMTFPVDDNGDPILPGVVDWDDGTSTATVTSGTTLNHSFSIAGTYNPTFRPTGYSSPTYTSVNITVS